MMNAGGVGTRRRIDLAGSQMNVIEAGQGQAVLLGHSFLWDAGMWRPQIAALAQRYRVIVPELWGHGESGRLPAGTTDLRDLAAHHLQLLDALGIDRFAMIGLSVGGMWGAELALLAPRRMAGLALVDTFLGPEPAPSQARYFGLLDVVAAAGSVPAPALDVIVPLFFSPDVASRMPHLPDDFRRSLMTWHSGRLRDSVVPLGRMTFGRRDILTPLAAARPTGRVICGAQDIPRPVSEARLMAETLGWPLVTLPQAGHISSLEAPEAMNQALGEFLDEVW